MKLNNARKPIPQNAPDRLKALHNLGVLPAVTDADVLAKNHTVVLSLDGGGYHIFWILELLKRLEQEASAGLDRPLTCGDIFDVVTGTSAGAITSAFIMKGWSAAEMEAFWHKHRTAEDRLYPFRYPLLGGFLETLTRCGLNLPRQFYQNAALFYDAPLFTKENFRRIAREEFSDESGREVTMGDLCAWADRGLFLLNKDTESGYILPLGCVPYPHEQELDDAPVFGYLNSSELLVGAALEAATSPPLQMPALGPFIDAGFGSYNDPVMATFTTIDRIFQTVNDPDNTSHTRSDSARKLGSQTIALTKKYLSGFYPGTELNVNDTIPSRGAAFAFGTAFTRNAPMPAWLSRNPLVPGMTWLNWYITDVIKESANLQNAFLRSDMILPALDFRSFNMSLSTYVLKRLNNRDFGRIPGFTNSTLHDLDEYELFYLTDMLEPTYAPVYQAIGEVVYEYMREQASDKRPVFAGIGNELVDYRPNMDFGSKEKRLHNRNEYERKLKESLGSSQWLREQPAGKPLSSYFCTPLPGFEPPYFQKKSPLAGC